MFVWDLRKAIANFEKHGISFEEAATLSVTQMPLSGKTLLILTRNDGSSGSVYRRVNESCSSLHHTEDKTWPGKIPHHQRAAGEPAGTASLYPTPGLIFRMYRNLQRKNWGAQEELADHQAVWRNN